MVLRTKWSLCKVQIMLERVKKKVIIDVEDVLSQVQLFGTQWTVDRQAPPWEEYRVGCCFLLQGVFLKLLPLVSHLLHW